MKQKLRQFAAPFSCLMTAGFLSSCLPGSGPASNAGACGLASGVAVSAAPTTNLCDSGNATEVMSTAGTYQWSCDGSSSVSCSAPVAVPAQAAAQGYTTNIFFDDFNDLSTIDLTNSQEPGFNWYPVDDFDQTPNQTTTKAPITLSATPTLVSNGLGGKAVRLDGSGSGSNLTGILNGVHGVVGNSFGLNGNHGVYFESRMAFGSTGSDVIWPAFWAMSSKHLSRILAPWTGAADPNYEHYFEFDFMEFNTMWSSASQYLGTVHDWYGDWGVSPCTSYCNVANADNQITVTSLESGAQIPSTEEAPVFHTYGALWVPSIDTDGTYSTGFIQYYFDDHETSDRINFTGAPPTNGTDVPASPWTNSIIDQDPQSIIFSTGGGAFMYIDWVRVWQ